MACGRELLTRRGPNSSARLAAARSLLENALRGLARVAWFVERELVNDDEGVLRVAGTRVTLDSIVAAFDLGATPEEIVQRYPSVDLASAYALIAYALRNRDSVDTYLAERAGAEARCQCRCEVSGFSAPRTARAAWRSRLVVGVGRRGS
jgi:uncharacterized protein (DUF433 family)